MYRCLSDRIAGTLRGELAAGRYGPGRDFPSVDALRQRFGAGEYAVRHALQRLRADGLLIHRQGMGTMPTPKASCTFKGRVAFVCPGQAGGFFRIALAIRLAQRFREAGWDFASVFLPITENGEPDPGALRMVAANGLAFAIFLGFETKVSEIFDEFAIPYIVLNGFARDFPNARAVIREDFRTCFAELIGALRARNVKTLQEFDIERVMDRGFRRQLLSADVPSGDDYMVVDLSDGTLTYEGIFATQEESNTRYNTDTYKTTKLVLRKVPKWADRATLPNAASLPAAGYPTGDSALKPPDFTALPNTPTTWATARDYYAGVFLVTKAQDAIIRGNSSTDKTPKNSVSWKGLRGATADDAAIAPTSSIPAVASNSGTFLQRLNPIR